MTTPIICKPTRWFFQRALGMLAMFLFLGGWFYKDASTGYRQKNEIFLLNRTFAEAADLHQQQKKDGALTDASWKSFAAKQVVNFGEDRSIIPASIATPMPWPEELQDNDLLSKGQAAAWEVYTARRQWDRKAPEKLLDSGTIREQWYFAYGFTVLVIYTLFILVRTMGRRICIDEEKITAQDGRSILFSDFIRLDLRKWGTKGLAFADYRQSEGKEGRVRIDGLTYGGFQKEQGEPAEALMQEFLKHFKGELIEYADETPAKD